uniref:Uncharacterized protein n=1 Tax=Lepeophtheirus salmonis TaxID=72036 RepID=A0A0K2UAZ3_LEPSM
MQTRQQSSNWREKKIITKMVEH